MAELDTSFQDITGALGDIFGTSSGVSGELDALTKSTAKSKSKVKSKERTISEITGTSVGTSRTAGLSAAKEVERLRLDPFAVKKIIQDVLGGAEGLASIFQGEQTAGIFDSSVAAQASGDLAAKLVGELTKLTAEKELIAVGSTKEAEETGGETTEVSDVRTTGTAKQTAKQTGKQRVKQETEQESSNEGLLGGLF